MPAGLHAPGALWRFEAIGVPWQIETTEPLAQPVQDQVRAIIESFDVAWSRFREDSLVTRLSRDAGAVPVPPDADAMLSVYADLTAATGGAVSPLIGDALARRGYGPDIDLVDRGPIATPAWTSLVRWDSRELRLQHPAMLDLGALGKGRLVDLVLAAIPGDEVVVDASGDLAVRGGPQRIGLEHPFDPRRAIGVWEVTDAALCASATNRRAWGDGLHHVLDARTGEPVRTVAATWAVAPSAMRADAIATALFFDGGERLAHDWGVEWVRMTTNGRVDWSPRSKAELFT